MIKRGKPTQHRCSFCGRGEEEVMILVSGMDGQICETCTEKAQEIINQELRKAGVEPPVEEKTGKSSKFGGPVELIPPKSIKTFLDKYVIGQDRRSVVEVFTDNVRHMNMIDLWTDRLLLSKNQTMIA